MQLLEIDTIYGNEQILDIINKIYHHSFPPEERRTWESFLNLIGNGAFQLFAIVDNDKTVGFISIWDFVDFRYIEHFAIDSSVRGKGLGSDALTCIIGLSSKPIVLEAELPEIGPMAQRRINFYSRHGFKPQLDFTYIQPPYADGLDSVQLALLTHSQYPLDLKAVERTLHTQVYGKQIS